MDWQLLSQHLISGYILVIPALLIYFIILSKRGRKQTLPHIIASFVFCFYLCGILTMTGLWNWWFNQFVPRIVLIPFADMIQGPIDTILNVILFIPLGIFLPMLYKRYDKIGKAALTGFLLSLSIEFCQMFDCGISDINDLITNTVGTCLGFLIYRLLSNVIPDKLATAFYADGDHDYFETVFYWVYSLIIMIVVQPIIYNALFKNILII